MQAARNQKLPAESICVVSLFSTRARMTLGNAHTKNLSKNKIVGWTPSSVRNRRTDEGVHPTNHDVVLGQVLRSTQLHKKQHQSPHGEHRKEQPHRKLAVLPQGVSSNPISSDQPTRSKDGQLEGSILFHFDRPEKGHGSPFEDGSPFAIRNEP